MFIGVFIRYLKAAWIDLFILVSLRASPFNISIPSQDLCPWRWKEVSMVQTTSWS